jgi:hypothetical protein
MFMDGYFRTAVFIPIMLIPTILFAAILGTDRLTAMRPLIMYS